MASKKSKKTEPAIAWAMGEITPKGIVIHQIGDHNTIEAASAAVNKKAGMRVAFVVDVRAVPDTIPMKRDWLAGKIAPEAAKADEDEEEAQEA